jgi:hypothetical protein
MAISTDLLWNSFNVCILFNLQKQYKFYFILCKEKVTYMIMACIYAPIAQVADTLLDVGNKASCRLASVSVLYMYKEYIFDEVKCGRRYLCTLS